MPTEPRQPDLYATDEDAPAPSTSRGRSRLIAVFSLLLVLVLFTVLPPLVNVSRFQKRIADNISNALGRPVHFDRVSLMLLPMPGFTLENFVVDEDPEFGYEPVLRADEVEVTLRLSSLWRPHVEFSKISFSSPSVNLVHAHGRWNIEKLLLQASHLEAAPTAQRFAGPARRFPYIEATGARLNLKIDQEKVPISLSNADFSLWLPEPHQWHIRLEADPMRTDANPGETGTIRAEGTLGAAGINIDSLSQIPIDLHGDWRDAQLGGISGLLLGHDPGLRGDFELTFALHGTVGQNKIATRIKLENARRADFVPDHMLSLEASCKAVAGNTFRSFTSIACRWPPADSSDPTLLSLTGDVRDSRSANFDLKIPALPADTAFSWLSVATPEPPAVVPGDGTLSGSLAWGTPAAPSQSGLRGLTGQIKFAGGSLILDRTRNRLLPLGVVVLSSPQSDLSTAHSTRARHAAPPPPPALDSFDLQPLPLNLGGAQPAILQGHFDENGYTLHLAGSVLPSILLEMAHAVPQFGDGLSALVGKIGVAPASGTRTTPPVPVHVDLTAVRPWGGTQIWSQAAATPAAASRGHRAHKP